MRKRRRSVLNLLNGREIQMSNHSSVHTLFNHIAERRKLDVAHLVHRAGHGGQRHVRVGCSVAVTREMLHRGYQAFALHSQGIGDALLAHLLRVFAKAAHTYNRIGRIGVDINDGRKVDMDAHAFALFRHLLPHLVNQLVVANGTQSHLIGIRQGLVDAHSQPPFGINGDHQRRFGNRLPIVGLLDNRLSVSAEETHTTNVVLLDVFRHILIKGLVRLVGTHANQLRDTLLSSKAVIDRIDPMVGSGLCISLTHGKSQAKNCNREKFPNIHNKLNFYILNKIISTIP